MLVLALHWRNRTTSFGAIELKIALIVEFTLVSSQIEVRITPQKRRGGSVAGLPSGVKDHGIWYVLLCVSAWGWPAPSARAWKMPLMDEKTTYWPSESLSFRERRSQMRACVLEVS
jgi:hypothetical protein